MSRDLLEIGALSLIFLSKILPVGNGSAGSPIPERVMPRVTWQLDMLFGSSVI
jgi:hypothetical protein